MDARTYVNILQADAARRREDAWQEMLRRPDALPLPPEPEGREPGTDPVVGRGWLSRAWRAVWRRPVTRRVRRSNEATSN